MDTPSIDRRKAAYDGALRRGFARARFISGFVPDPEGNAGVRGTGARSAMAAALPYGNQDPDLPGGRPDNAPRPGFVRIDLFSRRDYYAEAIARLQDLGKELRSRWGGRRSEYRVFCNSPAPEGRMARGCGLGRRGRNSLLMIPEAGSLFVLAFLTLPFPVENDEASPGELAPECGACAACVAACPTGALDGTGRLDRERCIQWCLSRPGIIPPEVDAVRGDRLYGCSECRDACPRNAADIRGADSGRGVLPQWFDAAGLSAMSDDELKARFRDSALGGAWCGPAALRRNAQGPAPR